jgi:predicted RecB family endonuclease
LERLADRLRIRAGDLASRYTKLPVADKLEEYRDDINEIITEVLAGLKDCEQVQIVTGEFGTAEAPERRSVARVYPERVARQLDAKVSDFIETKVTPRSRRAARTLLSALALGMMVYLAFVFVDTVARGQFTWTLRIAAVLAFVGICGALWYFVP